VSVNPALLTSELMNQSLWNLVCISWHLSPSPRCTPITLRVCMCIRSIVARQWLCRKYLPSVTRQGQVKTLPRQKIQMKQKNCLMRRFLCGPRRIKGKHAIRSSQNLFTNVFCWGKRGPVPGLN
jgi:hypothetical protein